jgi:hypothetical protein
MTGNLTEHEVNQKKIIFYQLNFLTPWQLANMIRFASNSMQDDDLLISESVFKEINVDDLTELRDTVSMVNDSTRMFA